MGTVSTALRRTRIGVIGAATCCAETAKIAYEVGREIARNNAILVCGGLGGVMEAAARGAVDAGGTTVGILPGFDAEDANPYIGIPVVTGMSHARNVLVVRSSEAVVAIEGGYGTLSEIALSLKMGIPVVGVKTWEFHRAGDTSPSRILQADDPQEVVRLILEAIKK